MANRKKTKEEKTPKSKVNEVASNIEERKGEDLATVISAILDAKDAAKEEISKMGEEIDTKQKEAPEESKQTESLEPKDEKPKLHVLADDRLNSLINTANELGITDVVQIINSEKYGQFYLIYRE